MFKMSGAEVLAGISILCNAMQIVTFGKDALEVYNHVRESGTADPRLESYLADASISYQQMRKQLSVSGSLISDQQEISRIGESAHHGLENFRTYFTQLYVDENSKKGVRGKLRIAKSGIKTLLRRKELEDLEKNFERYQELFQTRLLQRVCGQGDAIALLTQEHFTNLNSTQQSMVKKIAEGHREMSLLVSQKAVEVKDYIANQHEDTRTALGSYLSVTENNLRSRISESTSVIQKDVMRRNDEDEEIRKYKQLMASLRYPEMNSRKKQVIENFPTTFQWIFSSKGVLDEANFSSETHSIEDDEQDIDTASDVSEERRTSRDLRLDYTASTTSCSDNATQFTRWLGSESKIFWVSGKPGSGKSTLMKFIATNAVTERYLKAWRSGVRILSHYFWKAGNAMEGSLKGLLLSITHQVLQDRMALAVQLWEAMPELRHKWSHGDWGLQQLESTLFWVLKAARENFFLIIDGLDECEEFVTSLYMAPEIQNILDSLAKQRDVKICVSSREEYIFSRRFQQIDRLRIHELTKYDIETFVRSRLSYLDFEHPLHRQTILNLIVSKADGVFLWVALVLDTVTRALCLDKSVESLIERIERAPRNLIDLVREMWRRSGEDGDVPSYRASASRYFSLALASSKNLGDISILNLTLASEEAGLEDMLDPDRIWDLSKVAKMCSKTEQTLSLVCHGLLESVVHDVENDPLPEPLEPYRRIEARFTHRCVIDFLRDTEDGSALLKACQWPQDEAKIRLMGADLICLRFIGEESCKYNQKSRFYGNIGGKVYMMPSKHDGWIESILQQIDSPTFPLPYRGLLLRKSHEWYMAELVKARSIWRYCGRSIFRQEPLKNEIVAFIVKSANLSLIEKLIAALPMHEFLNTLPAIFRGLSTYLCFHRFYKWQKPYRFEKASLTKQVLTRLLKLQEDGSSGDLPPMAFTEGTREHLQRLVCSWFLGSLNTKDYDRHDEAVRRLELEVLQLIELALPSPEDWNQSVLLQRDNKGVRGFMYLVNGQPEDGFVVVANLATVHQIFLRFVQSSAATTQSIQGTSLTEEQLPAVLNSTELSLRIVLIANGEGRGAYHMCEEAHQQQCSELLLNYLVTGRCLTEEEITTVERQRGDPVPEARWGLTSYLISKLGHIPGLPMHPWSAWLVYDPSGYNGDRDLRTQVHGKSREMFKKVIDEISQDL